VVVIENITPQVELRALPGQNGRLGESVAVEADVFHGRARRRPPPLSSTRHESTSDWHAVPMTSLGNDRWQAAVYCRGPSVATSSQSEAWVDHLETWRQGLAKKIRSGPRRRIRPKGRERRSAHRPFQSGCARPKARTLNDWANAVCRPHTRP